MPACMREHTCVSSHILTTKIYLSLLQGNSVFFILLANTTPNATQLRQGNVFTHVCHSVHRGCVYPSMHWGRHSPWADTPQQTPPGRPPWADTPYPLADNPLGRHPPKQTPLLPGRHPPGRQYASCWNAFLFVHKINFLAKNLGCHSSWRGSYL